MMLMIVTELQLCAAQQPRETATGTGGRGFFITTSLFAPHHKRNDEEGGGISAASLSLQTYLYYSNDAKRVGTTRRCKCRRGMPGGTFCVTALFAVTQKPDHVPRQLAVGTREGGKCRAGVDGQGSAHSCGKAVMTALPQGHIPAQ